MRGDAVKRAYRDQRKAAAREQRVQRRRQLRCWWTRPWGHEYVETYNDAGRARAACVACDKPYPTSSTPTPTR